MADSSSAIIRELFGSDSVHLQIDPRPLRTTSLGGVETSEDALAMARRPTFRTPAAGEMADRTAVLRGAGIAVGDIHVLDGCPGVLGLATAEELKPCPGQATAVAAFGVLDSADTRAVVQVVVLATRQGKFVGKFGRITPYEMAIRDGRWVLVKLGQTIIVE